MVIDRDGVAASVVAAIGAAAAVGLVALVAAAAFISAAAIVSTLRGPAPLVTAVRGGAAASVGAFGPAALVAVPGERGRGQRRCGRDAPEGRQDEDQALHLAAIMAGGPELSLNRSITIGPRPVKA